MPAKHILTNILGTDVIMTLLPHSMKAPEAVLYLPLIQLLAVGMQSRYLSV